MKKALKGTAGTFLALPFLIGMGPLYIANTIRFAAKKEEDIYAYELNKLLQSRNANDKKQAISHLSKMLAKNENIFAEDKQSIKYDVAQNFLSKNAEQIVACLDPKYPDLCAKTISFLVEISNNDSYSFCNNIIFKNKDLVAKNIVKCLDTEDPALRAAAINLLTEMLKKEDIEVEGDNRIMGGDVKDLACKIIINDCFKKIEKCLESDNLNLKANTISLLTKILNNEPYSFCNIIGRDKAFSENIVKCLDTENPDLRAGAINLFTKMLKSEISDVAAIAGETIKRCFESGDLNLKANTISLLTEMLNNNPTTLHNIIGKDKALSAKNIAECLTLENLNLYAGTINLLIKML